MINAEKYKPQSHEWIQRYIIEHTPKPIKNRSFLIMAVTFDQNKIFQFCFDILKGNRNIFRFSYEYKELTQNGAPKMTKLIFSFLARQNI